MELPQSAMEMRLRVFQPSVTRVEIGTHAKFNRVCSYCPNAIIDRRMNNTLAVAAMLDRVFDELGSIDYQRQICVARYSEPLTNKPYLYDHDENRLFDGDGAETAARRSTRGMRRPRP